MVKVVKVNILYKLWLFCLEGDWTPIALNDKRTNVVSSDSVGLYLCHRKKNRKSDFQVAKSPSFSLTNPSSSSLSDQEAVALRLAPVEREKLCVL